MKATAGARLDLSQQLDRITSPRMISCSRCGTWYVVERHNVERVLNSGVAKNNNFLIWLKEFVYCCNNPRLRWVEKTARIITITDEQKGGEAI